VDLGHSVLGKKQLSRPVLRSSVPGLGPGQLGSVAGVFGPGSHGKHDAGHSSAVGNTVINSAALVLPLPDITEALESNKADTPQA